MESPLAIALKTSCSFFATTCPENWPSVAEITSLSLTYSNLTTLPESLGLPLSFPFPFIALIHTSRLASFANLTELDLSDNPLGDSFVPQLVPIIISSRILKTLR